MIKVHVKHVWKGSSDNLGAQSHWLSGIFILRTKWKPIDIGMTELKGGRKKSKDVRAPISKRNIWVNDKKNRNGQTTVSIVCSNNTHSIPYWERRWFGGDYLICMRRMILRLKSMQLRQFMDSFDESHVDANVCAPFVLFP